MGRNAGWLTAAAALARNEYNVAPDLIYLPEVVFDKDTRFKETSDGIERMLQVPPRSIVVLMAK